MKRLSGYTERTEICLTYEKIKRLGVDLNKLVYEDEEQAIDYLHEQYRLVDNEMLSSGVGAVEFA